MSSIYSEGARNVTIHENASMEDWPSILSPILLRDGIVLIGDSHGTNERKKERKKRKEK
jgi:hypothetical protein